jgi:hypothetical protein
MSFVLYPDSESLVIVKRLDENEGSILGYIDIAKFLMYSVRGSELLKIDPL